MQNRALLPLLIVLLCTSAIAQTRKRAEPREAPVARAAASVVTILTRDGDGVFAPHGSGFVVKQGVVASVRDASRDDLEVFVKAAGSDLLRKATPMPARHETDIDLYRVDRLDAPPLRLARRKARVGERVVAVGAALLGPTTSEGTVTRLPGRALDDDEYDAQARMASTTAEVRDENAGGPLLAGDGTVLGIADAFQTSDGAANLAVPAAAIAARLAGRPEPGLGTGPSRDRMPDDADLPPVLAPTTHPVPRPPVLPVAPTILADPSLILPNPDDSTRVMGPPSSGSGSGEGMGVGTGRGVAPRTPPDSSADESDPAATEVVTEVVTKVRILNSPRPGYTDQARQNGTQGSVIVKALFGRGGRVMSARIVQGLPDGLNEEAIKAVYQFQFVPAKNAAGEPVDSWVTVSVNFSIVGPTVGGTYVGSYEGSPGGFVQFTLAKGEDARLHGFAIFEDEPGHFSCAIVLGTNSQGAISIETASSIDGCRFVWIGTVDGSRLAAREQKWCNGAAEPVVRTVGAPREER